MSAHPKRVNLPESLEKRVVIVGGGFAGIQLARKLINKPYQVVVLDKHNYHTFQPLLYQVATGGLEPDSIAYSLRRIFRGARNVYFRMAEVERIEHESKCLQTNLGPVNYDYLVLATGSKVNYFSLTKQQSELMPLKSVTDALDLRSLLVQNMETAPLRSDPELRKRLINVAIVGGGPTGVELAGALAEMRAHVLPKDFPEVNFADMSIHLFQSGDRLLKGMAEKSSTKALQYLKKMGVDVRLHSRVSDVREDELLLESGEKFTASTIIWSAGVRGNRVAGLPDSCKAGGGRLLVDAFNHVKGFTDVFAVGDLAAMVSDELPYGHPMLAPVAIQQGKCLARNLLRVDAGRDPEPFRYKDKGSMATIGRNKAVAELPSFRFAGFFAWVVWLFVHIMYLVGFRNKAVVLMDWIYNYLTFDRALGLIIRPFRGKALSELSDD